MIIQLEGLMSEDPLNNLNNQADRLDYAFNYTRNNFSELKGMKAKEAYSHLQLSQSTFTAYRKGSEPSAQVLKRLSEPCGFNIHWLVTGEGSAFIKDSYRFGHILHIANEEETILIGKDILKTIDVELSNLRFDTVLSNDMSTTASAGNVILIDITSALKEGLVVVEYENQRLLRRVQMKSSDEIVLISETSGSMVIPKKDIKILGRVIWRAGTP